MKSGPYNPEKPYEEVEDGRIDFNHVNFSYRKTVQMILLHDIDIHINAVRQLVLLVVQDGKIKFCEPYKPVFRMLLKVPYVLAGKDVRTYDMDALRNQVAVVLQKNVLFSGTIT